jgi:AcrR family transcriptional regulator
MKKMNVKERILIVAREKFFKHGFYKVSLDSLVKDLHTSKSSLYNHFESKDALVHKILLQLDQEINSKLEDILNDRKLSFFGRLSAITEFTSDLLKKTSEDFLHDLKLYTPDLWEIYLDLRQKRINRYYWSLFESGVREGIIRKDLNLNLILIAYFKLTEISIQSDDFKKLSMTNQEAYNQISTLFLEGIMKKNKKV